MPRLADILTIRGQETADRVQIRLFDLRKNGGKGLRGLGRGHDLDFDLLRKETDEERMCLVLASRLERQGNWRNNPFDRVAVRKNPEWRSGEELGGFKSGRGRISHSERVWTQRTEDTYSIGRRAGKTVANRVMFRNFFRDADLDTPCVCRRRGDYSRRASIRYDRTREKVRPLKLSPIREKTSIFNHFRP